MPKHSRLEILDISSSPTFTKPIKRIYEAQHVAHFLSSRAYRDIGLFIFQLNYALCPRHNAGSAHPLLFTIPRTTSSTPSIQTLQILLSHIRNLINDAPPHSGPRRFGNAGFRTWHALLTDKLHGFLNLGELGTVLQIAGSSAKDEVASYLLGSFGNPQRLDYGTGHELNFITFIGCLWKLGYFKDGVQGGSIEREITLSVIESYLNVVRQLILTYTLEPAGSHGVWGLDDHSFVPYIFGSAQLTQAINDNETMPTSGTGRGCPQPSDIVNADAVQAGRLDYMYFSAIGFINDVKKGPFWEHSPMLYDISGIQDGWGKINKGMMKMFNAEVLSKFPVIQHFQFGSLFSWDEVPFTANE